MLSDRSLEKPIEEAQHNCGARYPSSKPKLLNNVYCYCQFQAFALIRQNKTYEGKIGQMWHSQHCRTKMKILEKR